jgi:hypothetical protein
VPVRNTGESNVANFKTDIENAAGGEKISAIVVGRKEGLPEPVSGRTLSWEEAGPILDYEYDDGFGGAECHAIYAWTENRVLFVSEYDGATSVQWLPRHPIDCVPWFGSPEKVL